MSGPRLRPLGALLLACVAVCIVALPLPAPAQTNAPTLLDGSIGAAQDGDLDSLVKRRQIRAAVPWSRTDYFIEKGRQHGMSWEAAREFEAWINRRYQRTLRRIHVVIIPCSRGELVDLLVAGKADIAIAGLTVTPELGERIDLSIPFHTGVNEVIVSRRASTLLPDRDSLAGQAFFVRASSSHYSSLNAITGGLVLAGLPAINIRKADEHLADEDILELVNAGVVERTVLDDYKARLWAGLLPDVRIEPVILRADTSLAWGLRKDTPRLKALVDDFLRGHRIGTEFGNVLAARYYGSNPWLRRPLSAAELARHEAMIELFRKYGRLYGFDPLLVTAQGFQESGLEQRARSKEGAIGVMQLLPRTGRAMKVGDIRQTEANIHAGLKYLRELADTYFDDERIDDHNRTLLAFAAYNAGPGAIRRMQRLAAARGLDPFRWFDHVERVTGERIGAEPVSYVANISKYYIAYRLLEEQQQARAQAREAVPR